MLDLLRHARAVVVPSEWYENCSMSVLEAMAYGKPVIGARIGGIPEQIRDGQDGLLFEPGNADALAHCMDRLTVDPALTVQMGQSARQRLIAHYSSPAIKTPCWRSISHCWRGNNMGFWHELRAELALNPSKTARLFLLSYRLGQSYYQDRNLAYLPSLLLLKGFKLVCGLDISQSQDRLGSAALSSPEYRHQRRGTHGA